MDLHLHSGMERPLPMKEWVDLAAADGRRAMVLVDHLELYRPKDAEVWRNKHNQRPMPYAMGTEGHRQFVEAVKEAQRTRPDLLIFSGWEISALELESGLELPPMEMVDFIGWHISPNNGGVPPDGELLLRRVAQVKEIQKKIRVPMVLFHPFPARLENIQRTAKAKGRDPKTITVEEYRFFHGDEQKRLAEALRGTSIYIEMSRATEQYMDDPVCREALIQDLRPLAEMGVPFTISTDAHSVADQKQPFHPEKYCDVLGCTDRNTNMMIRELLAQRVRKQLLQ